MEDKIRFRYVMSQLSGEQLREVMTQVITENDDEIVIQLLWDHICKKNDNELALKCIEIASTIMQEDLHDEKNTTINVKSKQGNLDFAVIPNSIVGKIGSYFDLKDHIQTSQVNRQFFIALRDVGPTIECLYIGEVIKYAKHCITNNRSLNSNIFKNITTLVLRRVEENIMTENQDILCQLKGTNMIQQISRVHFRGAVDSKHIMQLLGFCNFNSVKRLFLDAVMFDENWITILSAFSNLKHFELHGGEYDDVFEAKWNNIKDSHMLSTVTEFTTFYTEISLCKLFTRKFAPKLERLHFIQSTDTELLQRVLWDEEISKQGFPKLFHLCYSAMSLQDLAAGIDVLQSFRLECLERIGIQLEDSEGLSLNAEGTSILKSLFRKNTIKAIGINAFDSQPIQKLFSILMDSIIGFKRDKLSILVDGVICDDKQLLKQQIASLVHVMDRYIGEFVLEVKCCFEADEFENLSEMVDTLVLDSKVVIRSKNCRLSDSDFGSCQCFV